MRRLKASPTLPCGIFNINYQRQAGHSHHFAVVVLSCCLVVLSCHVRVSEGEQRRLTDAKCYIFSKSSQQLWFKWEGSKVFQGGWPCQVWKEASFLFLLRPQVLYIFEILSANVTQWEGYQVLRRLTLPSLEISFNLIFLRTLSDIYFWNPLSICDILRGFSSSLERLALPSYVIGFYWVFLVFSGVLGCSLMVLGGFGCSQLFFDVLSCFLMFS